LGLALTIAFGPSAQAQDSEEKEETPGPGSEESDPFVALPPPLLRPPAGLELAPDSPASRASLHLQRAAAIHPLTEQLVAAASSRFTTGARGPVRPSAQPCAEAEAIRRLSRVAQTEFEAELKTGRALLESVSSEITEVRVLRDLSEKLTEKSLDLRKRTRYIDRQTQRWRCRAHGFDGLAGLRLSPAPREPAGRPLLVEATGPHRILWLDGKPAAASGELGWALVLIQRSGQKICESDPRASSCRRGREVDDGVSAYLSLGTP
jgi:hypothetical protein